MDIISHGFYIPEIFNYSYDLLCIIQVSTQILSEFFLPAQIAGSAKYWWSGEGRVRNLNLFYTHVTSERELHPTKSPPPSALLLAGRTHVSQLFKMQMELLMPESQCP